MADYGYTPDGFVLPTSDVIKGELEDAFRAAFGQGINVGAQSAFGQIIGIMVGRELLLWQALQIVYSSVDPDKAQNFLLDAIEAIRGVRRLGAVNSLVTLTCTGTPGDTIPAIDAVATAPATGAQFASKSAGTFAAVAAWGSGNSVVTGQRVKNGSGPVRVYQCLTAGICGATGGPHGTGDIFTPILDGDGGPGTPTWIYLGDGEGVVDIPFTATVAGAVSCVAGDLTTISTPVTGWNNCVNLNDAALGSTVEPDPAYRLRGEEQLQAGAGAVGDAIRAAVLAVEGVTSCTVFENKGDTVNGDGMPPHSVEVLVTGGIDQNIRDAIYSKAAGGINAYGNNAGTVLDSSGNPQPIAFSRPTVEPVYFVIHCAVDSTFAPGDMTNPASGVSLIALAIVTYGQSLLVGKDVVSSQFNGPVFSVPGVKDVSAIWIGLAPAPTMPDRIVITARELATFDTSRVSIVTTAWDD